MTTTEHSSRGTTFNRDDIVDYVRFTTELEFEPGVKFWDRPFFLGVDKHTWHVTGAHDFTPMATTHYVNRLERFTYSGGNPAGRLAEAWPLMREAAEAQRLASIWLLFQPYGQQIGIVTVAARVAGTDDADAASRSIAALEHCESPSRHLPRELASLKLFDRTSLNLSLWLPQSRSAGGPPQRSRSSQCTRFHRLTAARRSREPPCRQR